jgi:hypothetical protein
MSGSTIAAILAGGAAGGLMNALLTQNGFALPQVVDLGGTRTVRPGFLGNLLIGSLAGLISWGLNLKGPASVNDLEVQQLIGAIVVGIAGSRWLTNEVDKSLLKAAATRLAGGVAGTSSLVETLQRASPAQALHIANSIRQER